ncbi:hypothetical protein EVAR_48941_1 [Eumeta japonica]|uniref:Uncharacterized protein n=1 Tax=Eumeta variegata TaxID=151549 RepID=A0A4C1Y7Q3_EUMVA|nr:hypothetical protein EVAR_48941_1 [Eumeta japonica]
MTIVEIVSDSLSFGAHVINGHPSDAPRSSSHNEDPHAFARTRAHVGAVEFVSRAGADARPAIRALSVNIGLPAKVHSHCASTSRNTYRLPIITAIPLFLNNTISERKN